jgi:cellulose synthase/poly-beta-1,6-N-acetylglucosamine synthase-like glycosyltransferase
LNHLPGEAADRVPRVVAVVPAHNEASGISATLASLHAQTRPVDRIIVVADNCTDDTAGIAAASGAEVIVTRGNRHRKAGALNQCLARLLPVLDPDDAVLVMDADSALSPGFAAEAARRFVSDPRLGAVGGVFFGATGHGLIGALQRNEYVRYAREIFRRRDRVMVLTGTAALVRVAALADVANWRRGPGSGQVYDTAALTEDNELTLALKTRGWRLVSPAACRVTTEVMGGWKELWHQRLRWQRGALENLRNYGLTRITARYWVQQVAMATGVLALHMYLILAIATTLLGQFQIQPLWLVVSAIFLAERLVTVWPAGAKARLIAATMAIEMLYDMFLQAVFIRSVCDIALRREARWGSAARRCIPATERG